MSRIGKMPVQIPSGVEVSFDEAIQKVTVKGSKGSLELSLTENLRFKIVENAIVIRPMLHDKKTRALWGLTRALLANMIVGVTEGYTKTLKLVGVGYRAKLEGSNLSISLGFSHPVVINPTEDIKFEVPDQQTIIISGIDKQQVGQVSAKIRALRKPEPYKGKGIRYENEVVRRKAGKSLK